MVGRTLGSLFIFILAKQTFSAIIDIIEATNGHEPRVAILCGRVPFYIDLETGSWVSDSSDVVHCDTNKEDVKSYCQKIYPKLNITNIVEANKPAKFNNWCKPGHGQCKESKKVIPYRCLVNEFEADALMVPNRCEFDHLHDENECLTHDQWKMRASKECKKKHSMKLKDYGILLSCKTDYFTGVEFVCCPKDMFKVKMAAKHNKHHQKKKGKNHKKKQRKLQEERRHLFLEAIKKFMGYIPKETKGCDRSAYMKKQSELDESHRKQIAAVVREWTATEERYLQLKAKDADAAEEKMNRTLQVFRVTLAALEKESKNEKTRLRAEHALCINTQIAKNKRDAMIAYMAAIQEEPVNADMILSSVRKFIQVCDHDRVHSLRHFEHVRNRDPQRADSLRGELLSHLKNLNKVVNESISLLNYLPDIAEQFGLTGEIGGAILKPRLQLPIEEHNHHRVNDILENAEKKYGKSKPTSENVGKKEKPVTERVTERPVTQAVATENVKTTITEPEAEATVKYDITSKAVSKTQIPVEPEPVSKQSAKEKVEEGEVSKEGKYDDDEDDVNDDVAKIRDELLNDIKKEVKFVAASEKKFIDEIVDGKKEPVTEDNSPFAVTLILGLSGTVLIIMLFIIITMVLKRRRFNQRVIITENNDEREHLVEMQKNGFENPTYKFFYY